MEENMKVELLAPGGSYESVLAALNAGADAVYTGGEKFGARANADNLSEEQLIDAIHYAHLHHKKIYLTINTLLKNQEIENELYSYLEPFYLAGLDAVIVQDFGVIRFIKQHFPELPIHASTQMTIFGEKTVKELHRLGVTRIVTPRELSLKEIENIYKNTGIEIESFVHGALCYCYSGQCLMSSFIGGRSGNRGRCAQPCRLEYDLIEQNKRINSNTEKYLLSPKDICALKILPEIIDSGVYSMKIEGRMKKTEYITGVVEIYRKYLDLYQTHPDQYSVEEKDIQKLLSLFNRNGFSESYYKQHNGRNMMSLKKVAFRAADEEYVTYLKTNYTGKLLKEPLDLVVTCKKGEPLSIKTSVIVDGEKGSKEPKTIEMFGTTPELAKKRPLDEETIRKQVSKMGNTDFIIRNLDIIMDNDIFLPVGEIKELRRSFINQITSELLEGYQRKKTNQITENPKKRAEGNRKKSWSSLVWNLTQINAVVSSEMLDTIYIEVTQFSKKELQKCIGIVKNKGKKVFLALPYVFRMQDEKTMDMQIFSLFSKIDGVLVRNIEQYFFLKEKQISTEIRFDYNIYMMNHYSQKYYESLGVLQTAPVELRYQELKQMNLSQSEMIVYGRIPLMISAGCGLKSLNQCRKDRKSYQLKDRKNNLFTVQCVCDYCYNIMLNCKPLSLLKFQKEIDQMNVSGLRLIFTTESEREVAKILKDARDSFVEQKTLVGDDSSTRGHFQRGVM